MTTRIRHVLLVLMSAVVASVLLVAPVVPARAAGTATVSGTVSIDFTSTRAPAGSVTLTVERWEDEAWASIGLSTTNDASGAFFFTGLDAGQYRVAGAPTTPGAYVPRTTNSFTLADGGSKTALNVILYSFRTIEVSVTLDGSTVPQGHASVRVLDAAQQDIGMAVQSVDAAGAVSFRLAPGDYHFAVDYVGPLSVRDRTMGYSFSSLSPPTSSTTVALSYSYTYRGHVDLGQAGHPAGAGAVTISSSSSGWTSTTTTDADGDFEITGIFAGTATITFTSSDPWFKTTTRTVVLTGATTTVEASIVLDPMPGVWGHVTDADGEPLEGIWVTLVNWDASQGAYADLLYATTDADGFWQILATPNLYVSYWLGFYDPADRYAATTWEGWSKFYDAEPLVIPSGQRVTVDVVMPRSGRISGTVEAHGSNPAAIAGVTAEILVFDSEYGWVRSGEVTSVESDGHYEFRSLFPDSYRVAIDYPTASGGNLTLSPVIELDEGEVVVQPTLYTWPAGTWPIRGGIRDAWLALNGERGPAGYPLSGEIGWMGGVFQDFDGGRFYWSARTGARFVPAESLEAMAANAWLGFPSANEICGLVAGGCYQPFQNGTLYTSSAGTWPMRGGFMDAWSRAGKEWGSAGYPVSGEIGTPGGVYQDFQNGRFYWSPVTGPRFVPTANLAAYAANPWLGFPTGDRICGLTGGGCYQPFQNGTLYTSAAGTWPMRGGFMDVWSRTGKEWGYAGYPLSGEIAIPGGVYQDFQNGRFYWSPATGPRFVPTASAAAYAANPWLGFPAGDRICGLVRGGCYQPFQYGTLYTSTGGVWPMRGGFMDVWSRTGKEWGYAGYPLSGEIPIGGGVYQLFEQGRFFWTAETGPHFVPTAVWSYYSAHGGMESYGFPTADAVTSGGFTTQQFQRDRISVP